MLCTDFFCLLKDLPADDRLVGIWDDHPPLPRHGDGLPGLVVDDLRFQQDQIAGSRQELCAN